MIRILEECDNTGRTYAEIDQIMGYKFAYVVAFRAWQLGLMVRSDEKPKRYYSAEGWRDSPYMPKARKVAPATAVPKGCSFIFNMGAMNG